MSPYSLTSAASSFDILPIPSEKQYSWSTVLTVTSSSISLRVPSLIPIPTVSVEVEKHCPMRATYEATHLKLKGKNTPRKVQLPSSVHETGTVLQDIRV